MTHHISSASLLQKLDQIKPDLKPLPTHYIASQDQHTRELYATMLAALLLVKGQVTEPETRLFGMLLQSMKIEATTAKFFELAQQIDEKKINEILISIKGYYTSFLIDAIIIMRLTNPLSVNQIDLISEFFDIFNVSEKKSQEIVNLSLMAIGLMDKKWVGFTEKNVIEKSSLLYDIFFCAEQLKLFEEGVWIDIEQGLMWSRLSIGQKIVDGNVFGDAEKIHFYKAKELCANHSLAGFTDWYLPSIEELESLLQTDSESKRFFSKYLIRPQEENFGEYVSSNIASSGYNEYKIKSLDFDGMVSKVNNCDGFPRSGNFFVRPVRKLWEFSQKKLLDSGIWIDDKSGLMWTCFSISQSWDIYSHNAFGDASLYDWIDVNQAISSFNSENKNVFCDWRLPTKLEMISMLIEGEEGYSCPEGVMSKPKNSYGRYWALDGDDPMYFDFDVGLYGKEIIDSNNDFYGYQECYFKSAYIRLVRSV